MSSPPCGSNDSSSDLSSLSNDSVQPKIPGCDEATVNIEIEDGVFLSCNSESVEELTASDGIKRVDLKYDYEMRTTEGTDLSSSVNRFEVDLLEAVADQFDLSSCKFVQRKLGGGRTLVGSSNVVGIGSYPADATDSVHTECEGEVETDDTSECTPMNGYLTAFVSGLDNRRLSESDLYAAIEQYSNTYSTNHGVLGVSYVGDRSVSNVRSSSPQGNMSSGGIAGTVIGSALAALALMAIVAKRRRNRKNVDDVSASNAGAVDRALASIEDEEWDMKVVNDDAISLATEDYSFGGDTMTSGNTFNPEEEVGFEVKL